MSSDARSRYGRTVVNVQRIAGRHLGVSVAEIVSSDRHEHIARARHVAMYACRKGLRMSLPSIAREFGGRDHTTVMSAVRKVEGDADLRALGNAVVAKLEGEVAAASEVEKKEAEMIEGTIKRSGRAAVLEEHVAELTGCDSEDEELAIERAARVIDAERIETVARGQASARAWCRTALRLARQVARQAQHESGHTSHAAALERTVAELRETVLALESGRNVVESLMRRISNQAAENEGGPVLRIAPNPLQGGQTIMAVGVQVERPPGESWWDALQQLASRIDFEEAPF